jgi:hypothetical protein
MLVLRKLPGGLLGGGIDLFTLFWDYVVRHVCMVILRYCVLGGEDARRCCHDTQQPLQHGLYSRMKTSSTRASSTSYHVLESSYLSCHYAITCLF